MTLARQGVECQYQKSRFSLFLLHALNTSYKCQYPIFVRCMLLGVASQLQIYFQKKRNDLKLTPLHTKTLESRYIRLPRKMTAYTYP